LPSKIYCNNYCIFDCPSCNEMTQNPSTRSHKHKTYLAGNGYSSSYCLHMPYINWYCLDNILIIFPITHLKTLLLYNLSWKSNTWNFMPLAFTKYLYIMYNVHHINIHNSFYFCSNSFVSFSLTWREDFHIRWYLPLESLWIHREW